MEAYYFVAPEAFFISSIISSYGEILIFQSPKNSNGGEWQFNLNHITKRITQRIFLGITSELIMICLLDQNLKLVILLWPHPMVYRIKTFSECFYQEFIGISPVNLKLKRQEQHGFCGEF